MIAVISDPDLTVITATYPSPKPTSTLASHLGQNVGLGEGQVVSFLVTYNDPTFVFTQCLG